MHGFAKFEYKMSAKEAATGSESPSSEKFVSNSLSAESLKKMKYMRLSEKLTDVTLVTAVKEIPCHRLVLSAASDYFYAMFTNNLRESTVDRIPLEFIDASSLENLVEFCYSGEIDLREDNVETILKTAKFLHINDVVNACCEFLTSRLDPSNCIGFSLFADSLGCKEFYDAAFTYVMDRFPEVVQNHEYYSISSSDLKTILSNDMLKVDSEETTFNCLMLWINYDFSIRKGDLPSLLEEIKLPLLSPQFLCDSIETHSILKEDSNCYNLILEAMQYHLLPEKRSLLRSKRTRPRKSTVGTLFMIGGMDGGKGSWNLDQYNLRSNTWSRYGSMTSRRLQFGAAIIGEKLYVVGGRDGLKTLNIVECFDFKEHIWLAMPSMSTHRHGLGVGVLGGPMYAVGGHDGWTYLSAVERWDPVNGQWSYVAPLHTQRSTAGVAVLNNRLYAVGGRDGSSCLRSVECFDPHRNRWTFCAPMSIRRGGAGVGVINGYLFALGGHDAPILNPGVSRFEGVERYDPRTDTWTSVAPMKIGRDAIGVGILGNKLIAVGGYDGQTYLKIVEAYDPESNEWEEIKELENGRAGMCVVVL